MFRILAERDLAALIAATTRAALFGRDDLAAVSVTGRHRSRFLHALSTQEVNGQTPPAVAANAHCDAQGRLASLFTMVVQAEQIVLWTDRQRADELVEALLRYRVAERVKVAQAPDLGLLEVIGPNAAAVLEAADLPLPAGAEAATWAIGAAEAVIWSGRTGGNEAAPHGPGVPAWSIQAPDEAIGDLAGALIDAGATVGCHAAREALRIAAGWPRIGLDVDDGSLPAELGLGATISFTKGCYLGQEAVAMLAYRGRLRRALCWIHSEGPIHPAAGWTLRDGEGRKAGRVGSGYVGEAGLGLATVNRRFWAADRSLQAHGPDGQIATVRTLATTVADAFGAAAAAQAAVAAVAAESPRRNGGEA